MAPTRLRPTLSVNTVRDGNATILTVSIERRLSDLQRSILLQALKPSPRAMRKFSNVRADFVCADAWAGSKPSPAARVALSRSLRRLEERGLLQRYEGMLHGHLHLGFRLTVAGRDAALKLRNPSAGEWR